MKKAIITFVVIALVYSCSGGGETEKFTDNTVPETTSTTTPETSESTDPMQDKGIGPVSSLEIPAEVDETMALEGQELFKTLCSACHKIDKRFVGPALGGVTERRTPEWIMNMILNPEVMVEKNAEAKKLLEEYLSPMANQNVSQDDARKILEYFRSNDKK